MDGVPVTSNRLGPSAAEDAGRGTPGLYRPRYELVAEEILQSISDLALDPGDRMPTENELASRLGTSRTVVREAVKILSVIGRISAQKGRGLRRTSRTATACSAPAGGADSSSPRT